MGRLEPTFYEATFAEKILLDAVGRDEDVRGFGLKFILDGAEEAESFLGDFEIARADFRGLLLGLLLLLVMLLIVLLLSWSAHMGVSGGNLILKPGNEKYVPIS